MKYPIGFPKLGVKAVYLAQRVQVRYLQRQPLHQQARQQRGVRQQLRRRLHEVGQHEVREDYCAFVDGLGQTLAVYVL